MDARAFVVEELPVACLLGAAPAERRAGDDGGLFAQVFGPDDASLFHRLVCGEERELREAIEKGEFRFGEVLLRLVACDLGNAREADLLGIGSSEGSDARDPGG